MDSEPEDLDATRAAIASRELVATASSYLTVDVASSLPFESLAPFKDSLKRFFSTAEWSGSDAAALSALVTPHLATGWWEHDLGAGIVLAHGRRDGDYVLWVSGASQAAPSLFDRAFSGPVVPEATPHPRKVKFTFGGSASPGTWHRVSDPDPPTDPRARRLLSEPGVTDVMVAGGFVTIGLDARTPWEERLEPLLALVTELFATDVREGTTAERTRDELLREGARAGHTEAVADLHLLDPNSDAHVRRLTEAMGDEDPRIRRVAVAILAESDDPDIRRDAVTRGFADDSRVVRRTAIDAAADAADEGLRGMIESALTADDPWVRWRAVRAIGSLGVGTSRSAVERLSSDGEFRVRFEVERVLRRAGGEQ